jgi:hypothetical protein
MDMYLLEHPYLILVLFGFTVLPVVLFVVSIWSRGPATSKRAEPKAAATAKTDPGVGATAPVKA